MSLVLTIAGLNLFSWDVKVQSSWEIDSSQVTNEKGDKFGEEDDSSFLHCLY